MRDRMRPRVPYDIEAMVRAHLIDWVPAPRDIHAEATVAARELNEMVFPDPDDHVSAETVMEWWAVYEPADVDEARARATSSIMMDLRQVMNFPHPRSWRRWKFTGRVASFLYTSGVTSSGGGLSSDGMDPVGGWVYHLPRLSSVLPRFGQGAWRMRPYLFGIERWWWLCWYHQAHDLVHGRGRRPHWPGPLVSYVAACGKCMPWTCCGAVGDDHHPGCVEA